MKSPGHRPRRSLARALSIARNRLAWDRRAESWDTEGSSGLTRVVEAVLAECQPAHGGHVVDLGCGSGQVTLPLAAICARVLAVDVSPASIARLEVKLESAGIDTVTPIAQPIETLELPAQSLDLVVSNYALHHLRDSDKATLLAHCRQWLAPGARLVIGDMMMGRGGSREDRAIASVKARSLLRRGPAGWWRVAKNIPRFMLRLGERPLPAARWEAMVTAAGFVDVRVRHVVSEAYVLSASVPDDGAAQTRRGAGEPAHVHWGTMPSA